MNGYTYNLIDNNFYQEKSELIEELTKIIPNKTDLILPILNIGIERGRLKNHITLIASDEIYYLTNHFDVLLKKDINYLNKIKKIIETIGGNYLLQNNPELKDKIEKASR